MNWRRLVAAGLVVGGLMASVGAPAQAAPEDWTPKTTWDLRPYGGVDYGIDLTGPSSDVKSWIGASDWRQSLTGGAITALSAKFGPEAIAATATISIGLGVLQYCASGQTTTFHIYALAVDVEKPGYTWLDRLLGREKYERHYEWILWGCSKG